MATARVPVPDAARFWHAMPTEVRQWGHVPRGMVLRAAIAFVLGGMLGALSSGFGGVLGLGFGFAVAAAVFPMLPEVDALRELLGLPAGERVFVRRIEGGVRIAGEWTAVEGTIRRAGSRIHLRAHGRLLSVPADAFTDHDALRDLLESA